MEQQLHWAIRVLLPTPLNLWTGEGDLTFDSVNYTGAGDLLAVNLIPLEAGIHERRASLELSVVSPAMRTALLDDPGPTKVEIRQIYSTDLGQNWTAVNRIFRGRLSNPRITSQLYSVDVVQRIVDIDRGRPLKWSDATQKRRSPGDRGFEMASQLEAGFDIRWPP